jgi:hypothetical protein
VGDGEFLHREPQIHYCHVPRGSGAGPGSVWKCRCGRRWKLFDDANGLVWHRRYWPWPR